MQAWSSGSRRQCRAFIRVSPVSKLPHAQLCSCRCNQVANHADVEFEEEVSVTDPNSGATTTIRIPKHFQIKCVHPSLHMYPGIPS